MKDLLKGPIAWMARNSVAANLLMMVLLLGGLIGMGIGAALGAFVPGYYRSVFSNGSQRTFDPVAVGVGQGLTQGIVFGSIIGLVLVGLFYWYRSRSVLTDASG